VLHAPRQSGKTTFLIAFAKALTESGQYAALYTSCEIGEASGDDLFGAQRVIVQRMLERAEDQLPAELRPPPFTVAQEDARLTTFLRAWSEACPRRLVVLFDEIDALRGQSLISVLRQLRDAFPTRPEHAPWSVVLCGLRDVRDYKVASGGDPVRLGTSSPFHIKVNSLTLGNFTPEQVKDLYLQHARETGQRWSKKAIALAHELSGGQPWLVNALAREIVEKMGHRGLITSPLVSKAKERLIAARQTHLDSLVARLTEPRVKRVLEPLMAGDLADGDVAFNDDLSYVVGPRPRRARCAAPRGQPHLPRGDDAGDDRPRADEPRARPRLVQAPERSTVDEEGGQSATYHEVAAQLVLMAWLQRIVNGGGFVDREYGVGTGRIDVLIRWPLRERVWQREALELKVWKPKKADPLAAGLRQLDGYLDRLALKTGTLVLFDRRPDAEPIEERCHVTHGTTPSGRRVRVVRA